MCPSEVQTVKSTFSFLVHAPPIWLCNCKYLFLCQANKYLLTDDSLQSALNPIPDQDPVEEQPGYMSALQREFQGLVGSTSVSFVRRGRQRLPLKYPVSNAVPEEAIVR